MLKLDDRNTWPENILEQLKAKKVMRLLKSNDHIEDIDDEWDIRCIFADVDDYARSVGIVGYHCTKQLPDKTFMETGLRLLDFETHHGELLDLISTLPSVSKEVFDRIKKTLSDWRVDEDRRGGKREHRLSFCLTRDVNSCVDECFFKYFGGEAVFSSFFFDKDPEVEKILEELGEPVVVEARLNFSGLDLWKQYCLGRELVGYFATTVNPDFFSNILGINTLQPVPRSDIVEVHPHKQFIQSLKD